MNAPQDKRHAPAHKIERLLHPNGSREDVGPDVDAEARNTVMAVL